MIEKFENYKTQYASEEGVDFLSLEGPLRAHEGWRAELDSHQVLSIPPSSAEIWREWNKIRSRSMGKLALKAASISTR